MKIHPNHKKHLDALKRIEGQVRGVQKMIQSERYCIDIMTQLTAIGSAVGSVRNNILTKHLDACVKTSFNGSSKTDKQKKIEEVVKLLKRFGRNA